MPAKAYRIFVGARNTPNHTFLDKDEKIIRNTVNRYFKGWTIENAEGSWDGQEEQTRIITVVDSAARETWAAGSRPVEAFAAQLKNDLKQAAVMVETGGYISIL